MNEESLLDTNQHPTIAPDPIDDDVDAVYDAFLPHLMSARRSYVRRRLGVVLLLPIILIAGVAWASTDEAPAQVATETELEEPLLSLIHISEPTRLESKSRIPS